MDAFTNGLLTVAGGIHVDIVFLALILASAFLLTFRLKPANRAHMAAALMAAFLLTLALKQIVAQERPCWLGVVSAVACPDDYSMPSMHAAIAFALAFACLRRPIFPVVYTGALLVAISRLALGVHSLADVTAGMAVGFVAAAIADRVVREAAVMTTRARTRAQTSTAGARVVGSHTHHEGARKFAQVLVGSFVFCLAWAVGAEATTALLFLVVLAGIIAFHLKLIGIEIPIADELLDLMERPQAPHGFGALTFCMGLILSLTLLPLNLGLVSVLLLTLSDSAAALVGAGHPIRLPHNPDKSYAGSAAFMLLAVLPAFFLAGIAGLVMVFIAAVIESLPLGVDDNLLIPAGGLAVLMLGLA